MKLYVLGVSGFREDFQENMLKVILSLEEKSKRFSFMNKDMVLMFLLKWHAVEWHGAPGMSNTGSNENT